MVFSADGKIAREAIAQVARDIANSTITVVQSASSAEINSGFLELVVWTTQTYPVDGTFLISLHYPKHMPMRGNVSSDGLPWEMAAQPLAKEFTAHTVRGHQVAFEDVFNNRFSPVELLTKHAGKIVVVLWAQILSGEHTEVPCYVAHLSVYWGGKVL